MGVVDRIARGAEFRQTSGLANPAGWLIDAMSAPEVSSGQKVSVETSLGVAPVWSAVRLIAETVAQMPFKVYRTFLDAESELEREEARSHRAWLMLHDSPNPYTTSDRFWATVTTQLLLYGNAYIEKRRSDGMTVDELYLLDPSKTSVLWDDQRKIKRFLQEASNAGRPGYSQTRRREWDETEVLHVFALSLNGIIGTSVIEWCRNALGSAMAREEFEGSFWNRGTVLSSWIEHPQRLGKQAIENLRQSKKALFGGSRKAHDLAVFEEGMTFHVGSAPLRDLQFVEAQQMSRSDIAVMFQLPPAFLGGSTGDSLTYATTTQNRLQLIQNAVLPYTNAIQNAVSRDPSILPQNVFHAEFVAEGLLRGDPRERADFWTKMFALKDSEGKRVVSVDYIAARENFPVPVAEKPAVPPPPDNQSSNGNTGNGNVQMQMPPELLSGMKPAQG